MNEIDQNWTKRNDLKWNRNWNSVHYWSFLDVGFHSNLKLNEIYNSSFCLFSVCLMFNVSLSLCLSVSLSLCLSVSLSLCLSVFLYVFLSVCLFACLFVCITVGALKNDLINPIFIYPSPTDSPQGAKPCKKVRETEIEAERERLRKRLRDRERERETERDLERD